MAKSKADEMADEYAIGVVGTYACDEDERQGTSHDFLKGMRTLLAEAERMSSEGKMHLIDPMGRVTALTRSGSVVMIDDLRALFEQKEEES